MDLWILFQFPEATLCASYRTWKQLRQHVRKGEKGIEILVPVLARIPACPESHHDGNEDGRETRTGPETRGDHEDEHTSSYKVVGFKIGHTFDVSQTESAPIPNPINMALSGDYQGVYVALAGFAKEILYIDVEWVISDNPNWGGACSYDPEGHPVRIMVAGDRSPLFRA